VDLIKNREVSLIVNTVEEDQRSIRDSWSLRNAALQNRITYYTTIAGARAACLGMKDLRELRAYAIQSLHETLPT
jgi:carbamoyl-phosphate synthase large subunit